MPKAKYQFEDFLTTVNDNCKGFVTTVHEMLLEDSYKPKIQVTKSTGFQLAYFQPKIKAAAGIILIFFVRNNKLMIRIYGSNHKAYLNVLNRLPESMVNQIDNADDCKKFIDPQRCWTGCMGYDFNIRDKRYQKCIVNCFQLAIDSESIPYLLEIIKSEGRERTV